MNAAFSLYPAGRAGIGLAVLRAAVITNLAAIGLETSERATILIGVIVVFSVMIAAGCLTRPTAVLALGSGTLLMSGTSGYDPMLAASAALTTGSLALLGSGAYSVDARLFGRRVITIAARPGAGPTE